MAPKCQDTDMATEHPLTGNMEMLRFSFLRPWNNTGRTWAVTVSERTFPRATAVPKCALEKKMPAGIIFKMATIAVLGRKDCNNFPLWFSNFV